MDSVVRVAVVGVGNCASSLVQGVQWCHSTPHPIGLRHPVLVGLKPTDLRFVAAFDVDRRKVGTDLADAILSPPNCTRRLAAVGPTGTVVSQGPLLDGCASHMFGGGTARFDPVDTASPVDVADVLRESQADVVVSFLPVGSTNASAHYAHAALEAGCGFVNAIPTFIASDRVWADRFAAKGLPLLGDDFKSHFGATRLHRLLVEGLLERGLAVGDTTQENWGGNSDFLNMTAQDRCTDKLTSKRRSIASLFARHCGPQNVYAGPARDESRGYVNTMEDRKKADISIEAVGFGGVPITVRAVLECDDSPNAAAVAIDVIRIAAAAKRVGMGGSLADACHPYFKHPPAALGEQDGSKRFDAFIQVLQSTVLAHAQLAR